RIVLCSRWPVIAERRPPREPASGSLQGILMSDKPPHPPRAEVQEDRPAAAMAPPCVMVICGATGDLTRRKLIPALYNLAHAKHLSTNFAIVGFAWDDLTPEVYKEQLTKDLQT